ncbi:MAG: hypothetical protein IJN90_07900 [Bacilli bacterium]|nr:hypothetical protein [Bacilli bacterium]
MRDNNDFLFNIKEVEKYDSGAKYHIEVEVPMSAWYDDMYFVVKDFNEFKLKHKENKDGKVYFEGDIELPTRALYSYYFSYFADGYPRIHKRESKVNNFITYYDYKISVNYDVPEWAYGEMMYHIFVDRFYRGSKEDMREMPRRIIHKSWNEELIIGPDKDNIWNNDFFGGDLKGIEEKLDYIQNLGCNILYLSPVVWSQSNHRYDTSDYENVDPYAGSNEDLKRLCDAAHKKGMKVVLDAVFNHTGNDSKYFDEYGSFGKDGAFNNAFGKYSNFYRKHFDNGKLYYDYWWGMPNLPVCDGYSKEWQEYILGKGGVIDKWFELGIDGLRLDVADELTDDFIEKIRLAVKRNKEDGFILGEVWKNPMRMNRGYISSGKGMDSVMNYPLIDALMRYFKYGDCEKLSYVIEDMKREYPEGTINTLMNFTSTHDISRPITVFGAPQEFSEYNEWAWDPNNKDHDYCKNFKLTEEEYKSGKEIYKAYMASLAFMPGILSIFYGDEVGVEGLGNLANRKPFPWSPEIDSVLNGSKKKKVHSMVMKPDTDLLEFTTRLGRVRTSESFLKRADINMLKINREQLMFERDNNDEKAIFVVNRTDSYQDIEIPKEYHDSEKIYSHNEANNNKIAPYGVLVLKKVKK